jgi:hypothetical protein
MVKIFVSSSRIQGERHPTKREERFNHSQIAG